MTSHDGKRIEQPRAAGGFSAGPPGPGRGAEPGVRPPGPGGLGRPSGPRGLPAGGARPGGLGRQPDLLPEHAR
ncbi:MAG: hypothetical protein CSA07_02055 [Bacteroidia bacterium]|nr:MAG: hypothetical protein CSA07_02055 [Bacteroidia bacterium]